MKVQLVKDCQFRIKKGNDTEKIKRQFQALIPDFPTVKVQMRNVG